MFATNAFGLPRVVPKDMSVSVEGKIFCEGVRPLIYPLSLSWYFCSVSLHAFPLIGT